MMDVIFAYRYLKTDMVATKRYRSQLLQLPILLFRIARRLHGVCHLQIVYILCNIVAKVNNTKGAFEFQITMNTMGDATFLLSPV